jgi:hypothetical protein
MKRLTLALLFAAALFAPFPAHADDGMSDDAKQACEALLCLSTSKRPGECSPSIQRYFSIRCKNLSDTLDARRAFLNLCPSASQDDNMRRLVDDLTNGAGFCDAASLNARLRHTYRVDRDSPWITYIGNVMPTACHDMYDNGYTDLKEYLPRYVGVPLRGGYWVEPDQYDAALAAYNARIAAEDAAAKKKKDQQHNDR